MSDFDYKVGMSEKVRIHNEQYGLDFKNGCDGVKSLVCISSQSGVDGWLEESGLSCNSKIQLVLEERISMKLEVDNGLLDGLKGGFALIVIVFRVVLEILRLVDDDDLK